MIRILKKYKDDTLKFLFYDYETFGTNPALDKPVQFACIRTDVNFNMIEEPTILFCYPPIDYLPNAEAILITGITPQYTFSSGFNEFYFAKNIYNILNTGNTCVIGYNNIRFDDEITRNIFYRNLLDPYYWTWMNGNSRWDLLDVVRAYYAFRPNKINWPINKLGIPSFKLEDISKANNISHFMAHDALSDVYATISLARFLKEKNTRLFQFLFQNRSKKKLLSIINIHNMKPMFYVSGLFGNARSNVSLIVPFLWHPKNKNILIGIDLTKNVLTLISYLNNIYTQPVNYNTIFSLGLIFVYINRCPILAPESCLSKKDLNRLNIDDKYCYKNLHILKNTVLIKKNILFILNFDHVMVSKDIDERIYDAFFCDKDKNIIKRLNRQLPLNSISNRIEFCDDRIKDILFRCKARNFPYFLKNNEKITWLKYCRTILNKELIYNYRSNIEILLKKYSNHIKKNFLLKELLLYVKDLENYIFS
ncbi:exodeoxyribonuclease I [Buchnera aphidicola]|uniref:exodeoxyribonuclease I n=1 Tax=Buchnera aphidicola TaxID=9 RepID=UPI003463CD9E